jgi:hypothetical protein
MAAETWDGRARGSAYLGFDDSWSASLVRYLFGPEPASPVSSRAVLAEIRRLGGVVSAGDVMRVTGLPRAPAESLLCRLAARHGGDVGVVGRSVLYRFPRGERTGRAPGAIWDRPTSLAPITGNQPALDLVLTCAALLVAATSATVIASTLATSAWQPSGALIPFLLSLLTLAMPLARLFGRPARLRQLAHENGRRGLLRALLERPAGAPVSAHALSHVWAACAGRAIQARQLLEEMRALGGEPDVDAEARLQFRFPDLDEESRALQSLRG